MRLAPLLFVLCSIALGQIHEDSNNARVYGGLSSSSGSTANTSGTPVKIDAAYALSGFEKSFDESAEGRLRYTGESTLNFDLGIIFSFTSSANNIDISLFVAKNGAVIAASEITTRIGTGTDVGLLSVSYLGSLGKDDYLEAFLDTSSGNPTITTKHLTMKANSLN